MKNTLLQYSISKKWNYVEKRLAQLKGFTKEAAESEINERYKKKGKHQGKTALWIAVDNKQHNIIYAIINFKLDPNAVQLPKPSTLSFFKNKKELPANPTLRQVENIYINYDAMPENKIDDGITAMGLAACYEDWPLVLTLIDKGASVDSTVQYGSGKGKNVLWFSINCEQEDVITKLLNKNVNVNSVCTAKGKEHGITPLWMCALRNERPLAKKLIERGADVNAQAIDPEDPNNAVISVVTLFMRHQNDENDNFIYELISLGATSAHSKNIFIVDNLTGLSVDLIKKILNGDFKEQAEMFKNFKCPITDSIPADPVFVAKDKTCYERLALKEWATKQKTTPLTRSVFDFNTVEKAPIPKEIQEGIALYIKTLRDKHAPSKRDSNSKPRLRNRSTSS